MIGTLRNAKTAYKHARKIDAYRHWQMTGQKINRSWKVLGCGSTRIVLLHIPTNVVYKVGRYNDLDRCNRNEAEISSRLAGTHRVKRYNHDIVIPEITAHEVNEHATVVAMMHYEGGGTYDTPCPPNGMLNRFEKAGWWDVFEINIAKIDTGWAVIDLGAFDHDADPLDSFVPMS